MVTETQGQPTAVNARELFRRQLTPVLHDQQDLETALDLAAATDRFLSRVGFSVLNTPELRSSAIALSEANRTARTGHNGDSIRQGLRDIAAVPNEPATDRTVDRQEAKAAAADKQTPERQRLTRFIEQQHGYMFRMIDKAAETVIGDTEARGRARQDMRDALVDGFADYIRFTATADRLTQQRDGLYVGVGSNIGEQIRTERVVPQLMQRLLRGTHAASLLPEQDKTQRLTAHTVEQAHAQTLVENRLLRSKEGVRRVEFHAWLTKAAREHARIAGTEWDQRLISRIRESRRQENGVAGAILYGPPGTGKTEMLLAANRADGLDTKVISMHRHSDFVQLIGEAPIPVGVDKEGQLIDRTITFRNWLSGLEGDELKNAVARFGITRDKLEEWAPDLAAKIEGTAITDAHTDELKQALLSYTDAQILSLQLGLSVAKDPKDAWVYGQVLQAFREGKRALLDEIDKASDYSLDGISYLLSMPPGRTLDLGGTAFQIPVWARVDATSNSLTVQDYLQNRFSPHVMRVDYPPTGDLLQKASVWLSNEQGVIPLSDEDQEHMVAVLTYLVPQIQALYLSGEKQLSNPFSLRNIKGLCQYVRDGYSVREAINHFILSEGALTHSPSELARLQTIVTAFDGMISGSFRDAASPPVPRSPARQLESSPLYTAVCAEPDHRDIHSRYAAVPLTPDRLRHLPPEPTLQAASATYACDNGLSVSLTHDRGNHVVLHDDNDTQLYSSDIDAMTTLHHATPHGDTLLASDAQGQVAVIQLMGARDTDAKPKARTISLEGVTTSQVDRMYLSADGRYITIKNKTNGSINIIMIPRNTRDSAKAVTLKLPDGSDVNARRISMNEDGTTVLVETAQASYLLPIADRVNEQTTGVTLRTSDTIPALNGQTGWRFAGADVLVHPNKQTAYALS